MQAQVLLLGSLDTKAADFQFVRDIMQSAGLETIMIDIGVLGEPSIPADIDRRTVARAGGADLDAFLSGQHKDRAMQTMSDGATAIVRQLQHEGKIAGIFSMGGTGGTAIATAAMRTLPVGIPKVMVSTVGGGDVTAYSGGKDIIFFPSIVDVSGLNRISSRIYANAAHALIGMVKAPAPEISDTRPLLAASMFGNTTPCVTMVKDAIEQQGYEVLVFHATGTGGRTMEELIEQGLFVGLLDITTTELADNLCGGEMDAGPERCMAAPRQGIPTVLVPGCVDMVNFWGVETMPEKYRDRQLYRWNPSVTLMRTNIDENREIGQRIAQAANAAKGPVSVLIPKQGVSILDSPGGAFWDPDADRACFDAIRAQLKPGIPVDDIDCNINDPAFARAVVERMLNLLEQASTLPSRPVH